MAAITQRMTGRKLQLYGGWRVAFWFILPSLIGFVLFYLYPTVRGIYISFTDWNLLSNKGEYIGTDNYSKMFDDPKFTNAMKVTGYYVFLNILSQTILAIFIAFIMDRITKSTFVRAVILLPWLIPNVIVALIFLWLLDGNLGAIGRFADWIGFETDFLNGTKAVIPTIAGINTWRHMGYTALLIFAGLQTIPKNLYEAAALDGATEFQMLRKITIPLMRPVLALVMVITVIGSFQVFDTVQVATGGFGGRPGGPVNASRVIYLYIYENAFRFFDAGYASALAVALLVVLMVVTALQLRILRANESDLA